MCKGTHLWQVSSLGGAWGMLDAATSSGQLPRGIQQATKRLLGTGSCQREVTNKLLAVTHCRNCPAFALLLKKSPPKTDFF